jgi:hypothetical protein
LAFLNRPNPDLRVINENVIEVRRALIAQLQKDFGQEDR